MSHINYSNLIIKHRFFVCLDKAVAAHEEESTGDAKKYSFGSSQNKDGRDLLNSLWAEAFNSDDVIEDIYEQPAKKVKTEPGIETKIKTEKSEKKSESSSSHSALDKKFLDALAKSEKALSALSRVKRQMYRSDQYNLVTVPIINKTVKDIDDMLLACTR